MCKVRFLGVALIIIFLFAEPLACYGQTTCQSPHVTKEPDIPFDRPNLIVPDVWIEQVANFDYVSESLPIVEEFERLLGQNSLGDRAGEGYLGQLFVNLDDDQQSELLLIIGWSYYATKFCVFKQIDEQWRLLYIEDVHEHYQEPSFSVANNRSPFKVFYLHQLYERGSGVYKEKYHFFKLINGKVYPCLRVIGKAHLVSWPTLLSETVTSSLAVSGDDVIYVTYQYRFFPGNELFKLGHQKISEKIEQDVSYEVGELPEEDFIRHEETVYYQWNETAFQYELNGNDDLLTPCKIARFGDFDNHPLFLEAFGKELEEMKTQGMPEQQFLLNIYLDEVQKEKPRIFDEK